MTVPTKCCEWKKKQKILAIKHSVSKPRPQVVHQSEKVGSAHATQRILFLSWTTGGTLFILHI